jgi:hypothetical protein
MSNPLPEIQVVIPADDVWPEFFQLYQSAFPGAERRTEQELISMIANPMLSLNTIILDREFTGLFNYWNFDSFFYIEHFAIVVSKRNTGIGRQFLQHFAHDKTVVLECELPEDELSKRRILFYQNLGFRIYPFSYAQPPYSNNKPPVSMLLLTNSPDLSELTFRQISARIAEFVYLQKNQLNER